MVPRVSGRNSFIRVNSIANPHPPKISKILIGASRCPRTWCVAVPDGATELERLRDRNQGIAPPSNADLIAIIRAKDDLICQLKTAALETDRLRRALRRHGITSKTQWGEGWLMSAADKARVRTVMDSGDAYVAAVATGTIASMRF